MFVVPFLAYLKTGSRRCLPFLPTLCKEAEYTYITTQSGKEKLIIHPAKIVKYSRCYSSKNQVWKEIRKSIVQLLFKKATDGDAAKSKCFLG
jgi:hypothetical protein